MKYLILAFIPLMWLTGCKKMDSTYREYVVPNGITYPGMVLSPLVESGFKKVKLSWQRGTDPKVIKARIYWNHYSDSIDVDMPVGQKEVSKVIPNLEENFYTFIIKTIDSKGNFSVPVEVSGASHGEKYQASLFNRLVAAVINTDNSVQFTFERVNELNHVSITEIEYTSTDNTKKTALIDRETTTITLDDYKLGTPYKIRTEFKSPTSFEGIFSSTENFSVNKMNKKEWSIVNYSSNYRDLDHVRNTIDGTPSTRWATLSTFYPNHYFTVDLGIARTIDYFSLWNYFPYVNAAEGPDEVQFLGSNDNVNFVNLGNFNVDRFSVVEQKFMLTGSHAYRYIKVHPLKGPKNFTVIGEFDVAIK